MKYPVISMRDNKVGFMNLNIETNVQTAKRNFENACMKEESLLMSHPEDFGLWKVGDFDTETGLISPCTPEVIITALEVI